MAVTTSINITHGHDDLVIPGAKAGRDMAQRLIKVLSGLASGTKWGSSLKISDHQATSSGVLTIASLAAGSVISVNGVLFFAVSGTPVRAVNEFKVGVSDTADALDFCTTFNAATSLLIANMVSAASVAGAITFTSIQTGTDANAITVETLGVLATGNITMSGTSGTLTGTINGVAVTATSGATDAASATAMATALNASANALVAGHIFAYANAAVCNIFAVYPGLRGNAVTLAASGTGATASGARLTGGAIAQHEGAQATGTCTITAGAGAEAAVINGVTVSVTWATSDNNTATLLAAAIAASTNPLIMGIVQATAATNVVTLTAVRGGIAGNAVTLSATGTGNVASGARLTGGATPTQAAASASTAANSFAGARLIGATSDAAVSFAF